MRGRADASGSRAAAGRVDGHDPADALRRALRPGEPDGAPVVHDEPHVVEIRELAEAVEPVRVAADRVVEVAALGARAEAHEVGCDAAGALEERRPQVAGVGHAVQPQHRRVAAGALRQTTGSPSRSASCRSIMPPIVPRRADDPAPRLDPAPAPARARAARPAPARLREAVGAAAPAPARRADPHRPLAVHERPQPRRRVPAPARPLPELDRRARGAARGGRGGDPPGRHLQGQVRAHPGDPPRAATTRPRSITSRDSTVRRRAPSSSRCPAWAARPRPACCCSPTDARHPGRHARLARRHAARAVPPGRAVRGAARRHARAHPARPGAGAPRQPAAPRPPHLPRAAAAMSRVRAAEDVPICNVAEHGANV